MSVISNPTKLKRTRGVRKPIRFYLDPTHSLNKGLVSYWPFGEHNLTAAGGASPLRGGLIDVGPLGNFASASALLTAGGHHGGIAAGLNGTTSWIEAQSNAAYDSQPGAWVLWFKTSTLNSGWPLLMERCNTTAVRSGIVLFIDNGTSKVRAQLKNSTPTTEVDITGGPVVTDGLWHCVVLNFDATTTCSIYLDGGSLASAVPGATWSFAASTVRFGKSNDSFFTFLLGSIGDARIYNRTLTPSEISQLYAEPYAGIYESSIYLTGPQIMGGGGGGGGTVRSQSIMICG